MSKKVIISNDIISNSMLTFCEPGGGYILLNNKKTNLTLKYNSKYLYYFFAMSESNINI